MADTQATVEFKELAKPERSRTYVYPNGEFTVTGVSQISVRPSGRHRLETTGGGKYIIQNGWIAIKIDVDEWSF